MFRYFALAALILTLALCATRRRSRTADRREGTLTEASDEIGVPSDAIGRLKTDTLSKEVELDFDASGIIERQPGAYARARDSEEERYVLPERYGSDRLVLMARDPRWIYAYWEIARERHQQMYERYVSEWSASRTVLRMYDITGGHRTQDQFDVYLNDEADNWYVRVDRPDHRFVAELGRLFPGKFVPIVRSNEVSTPPESVSMEIAEDWAHLDWDARYGRYVGKGGVASPLKWGK